MPNRRATPTRSFSQPRPGVSHPPGASLAPEGVNFSVWARTATAVDLLLFDHADDAAPARVITLDPHDNRTFSYWHVLVPGVRSGQIYGWRVHGASRPWAGLRHDAEKVLLDPYATGVVFPAGYDREAAKRPGDNTAVAMKSVFADLSGYDWEGDRPLEMPFSRTVIYEMHVAGFTKSPTSGLDPRLRGTYAGVVEKIPYLRQLGVTAVELLPVQAFDRQDAPPGRVNYWGYSPVAFFAPHPRYAATGDPVGVLDEFRDMVKALHRAGIEVILDVVFNHTSEGDETGPTFCWRGLDNDGYYILDPSDKASYRDYTGCGNTLQANHSVPRRMILDALRHWVANYHVDGFRFDLASILARDDDGNPMADPPVIWEIETDAVLAGTKIIAEAWDAAGLYQVGDFVGNRWREWNGKFRDDVRRFVKGDRHTVVALPNRLIGSPDLYSDRPSEVEHSVNFVTCHDGFTMYDLVSYDRKHNEANGEDNRDGADDNESWNCGWEGPTDDPAIERLRTRQMKNLFGLTVIAMGVPMILMGDEVCRTQRGNNNAYCQDNEISWFDWRLVDARSDMFRFVAGLIRLRLNLDMTTVQHGLSLRDFLARSQVEWHGVRLRQPDWGSDSHSIALTVRSVIGTRMVHAIVNAYWEPLDFELPPAAEPALPWRRHVDTALDPPYDISGMETAPIVTERFYRAAPRSVAFLMAPLSAPT